MCFHEASAGQPKCSECSPDLHSVVANPQIGLLCLLSSVDPETRMTQKYECSTENVRFCRTIVKSKRLARLLWSSGSEVMIYDYFGIKPCRRNFAEDTGTHTDTLQSICSSCVT